MPKKNWQSLGRKRKLLTTFMLFFFFVQKSTNHERWLRNLHTLGDGGLIISLVYICCVAGRDGLRKAVKSSLKKSIAPLRLLGRLLIKLHVILENLSRLHEKVKALEMGLSSVLVSQRAATSEIMRFHYRLCRVAFPTLMEFVTRDATRLKSDRFEQLLGILISYFWTIVVD